METSFCRHLNSLVATPASLMTKGERTRQRLKAALAGLIEARNYSSVRISDICAETGISQGAFYRYFPHKEAVTTEVLSDFDQFTRDALYATGRGYSEPYDAFYSTTEMYVAIFRSNPGLMKLLLLSNQEIPSAAGILLRQTNEWATRMSNALLKRASGPTDERATRFASYAVGAMVDQTLAYLYIYRDPNVLNLVVSETDIVEKLTALQFKAAFGAMPPARPRD
jgi:AcrR family transcriptional regulator